MKKYGIISLMLCLVIVSCNNKEKAKGDKSSSSNKWVLSELTTATLSTFINLPAVLKPFESVPIYPRVNGFIKDIYVDRGSLVKKGQTLILLDAPEIEQQLYAAKSKYLQAYALYVSSRDNYTRLYATAKTPGTVAVHDLEQVQAKMLSDSAVAESEISNYRAMEAMKNYLTVVAPFDGVITERNVHPGALVGPNSKSDDKPLLILEQQNHLRLVIDVPEVYSNQLRENTTVSFHVNSLPGKVFNAIVSRQAGAVNMKYRSETIEADVYNDDKQLKSGTYAEVKLPVERIGPCYVVPTKSIITSTEKKYIICVRDGKTKWIDIQEGNNRNDSTEIFGNLMPNDKIIINASDGIEDNVLFK